MCLKGKKCSFHSKELKDTLSTQENILLKERINNERTGK